MIQIYIVTGILVITIYLLVSEKISVDITAVGIIAVLIVSGVLKPAEAVSGFANPAIITVAAMFVLSQGMIRTGAVEFIGEKVIRLSKGSTTLALLTILSIVGVASAFINNTPVVVLFIPVVISLCCQFGLSPSKFLIPVSYASILAGTCTLIGTSTNIIVSDLSAASGYGALGMFELAWVGLPMALVGLVFLLVTAPRFMPGIANPACELQNANQRRYLIELSIPRDSPLVGHSPTHLFETKYREVTVIQVVRYNHIYHPTRDDVVVAPDDLLLIKGPVNDLMAILRGKEVSLPFADINPNIDDPAKLAMVAELIIPPQSSMRGQRLMHTHLMRESDVQVLAIERKGLHYTEKQVADIRLSTGDILLIRLPEEKLSQLRNRQDYILVEDVHETVVDKGKAGRAGLIFGTVMLAASTGLADIMTCALCGMTAMLLARCVSLRDAYRALEGGVLLLIAATIALGVAMQKTGASQQYADLFLSLFAGQSPYVILVGFMLLTSISTHILSNNATAVLLLPVAISTAMTIGVNPKTFIIAICLGANACFASPLGYQTNLLVYGPGGYRFVDYFKLGIPLNLLYLVMGTLLIPRFWPF